MISIGLMGVVLSLLGIALFSFWFWMLIDCLNRPDDKFLIGGNNARLIWLIVIIFVMPFLVGALMYYFMIKRKDK